MRSDVRFRPHFRQGARANKKVWGAGARGGARARAHRPRVRAALHVVEEKAQGAAGAARELELVRVRAIGGWIETPLREGRCAPPAAAAGRVCWRLPPPPSLTPQFCGEIREKSF